jgi:hypothetical protein
VKRLVSILAGAAAALLAAVLLRSTRDEEPASVAARTATAAAPHVERLPHVAEPTATPVPAAEAAPSPAPGHRRLDALARRAGVIAPSAPTSDVLASFGARELDLFARLARVTGRSGSPEARALVDSARTGASPESLIAEADRLFAEDPVARAVAREWVRKVSGAPRPAPQRKPLERGRRLHGLAPGT